MLRSLAKLKADFQRPDYEANMPIDLLNCLGLADEEMAKEALLVLQATLDKGKP